MKSYGLDLSEDWGSFEGLIFVECGSQVAEKLCCVQSVSPVVYRKFPVADRTKQNSGCKKERATAPSPLGTSTGARYIHRGTANKNVIFENMSWKN
jgi:hypothetical protein